MNAWTRRLMSVMAILAVCGIVVSSISLQHHYAKSKTEYCEFGEAFNCDLVNRSIYSSIFGIPVALIGMLGYATLAGLATVYRERVDTPRLLLIASVLGFVFALRLTYIEGYVLGVWCILCLSSQVIISVIAALSLAVWLRSKSVSH